MKAIMTPREFTGNLYASLSGNDGLAGVPYLSMADAAYRLPDLPGVMYTPNVPNGAQAWTDYRTRTIYLNPLEPRDVMMARYAHELAEKRTRGRVPHGMVNRMGYEMATQLGSDVAAAYRELDRSAIGAPGEAGRMMQEELRLVTDDYTRWLEQATGRKAMVN